MKTTHCFHSLFRPRKLLFAATVDGQLRPDALVEESIRVVRAPDRAGAIERAHEIAHDVHRYTNVAGETVAWVCLKIVEIQDLDEEAIEDGVEVFSTLRWLEPGDMASEEDGRDD